MASIRMCLVDCPERFEQLSFNQLSYLAAMEDFRHLRDPEIWRALSFRNFKDPDYLGGNRFNRS